MSTAEPKTWTAMRDKDSQLVEKALRREFPLVEAYRYNSASIRVRVIDPRFANLSIAERDDLVAPHLESLPESLQADIMMLLALTPEEVRDHVGVRWLTNLEFEHPSRSLL